MLRRIILALTFVAALGVAGLGMSKTADAWHSCNRGYYGGYGGYSSAYYGGNPYDYSPRYWPRYSTFYGAPVYYGHRHHHHSGVHFSFGF
jgi:hypothetical protein